MTEPDDFESYWDVPESPVEDPYAGSVGKQLRQDQAREYLERSNRNAENRLVKTLMTRCGLQERMADVRRETRSRIDHDLLSFAGLAAVCDLVPFDPLVRKLRKLHKIGLADLFKKTKAGRPVFRPARLLLAAIEDGGGQETKPLALLFGPLVKFPGQWLLLADCTSEWGVRTPRVEETPFFLSTTCRVAPRERIFVLQPWVTWVETATKRTDIHWQ